MEELSCLDVDNYLFTSIVSNSIWNLLIGIKIMKEIVNFFKINRSSTFVRRMNMFSLGYKFINFYNLLQMQLIIEARELLFLLKLDKEIIQLVMEASYEVEYLNWEGKSIEFYL